MPVPVGSCWLSCVTGFALAAQQSPGLVFNPQPCVPATESKVEGTGWIGVGVLPMSSETRRRKSAPSKEAVGAAGRGTSGQG